jgi:hypothetical protein
MKKKPLLLILLFCLASVSITNAHPQDNYRLQIEEVVGLVEEHFYDAAAVSSIQWKEAVRQLRDNVDRTIEPDQLAHDVNSLLATLNTSHTNYFSKATQKGINCLACSKDCTIRVARTCSFTMGSESTHAI